MPYFSRLTDIVTCNLSSILAKADDPKSALDEIIQEIQQGVAGARRSADTAEGNVGRIETEIAEQRHVVTKWLDEAKEHLANGNDDKARGAIERKQECEDLLAGLEQQLQAAVSTRDHLRTTLHAIEARLADAKRRRSSGVMTPEASPQDGAEVESTERKSRVDSELDALRRQLGG
ncbi:MAG: PspA/IM30 family protein [Planctomycetaceae bacterium]|nr:PspA/IM30 family protein [Planctomycetaceae bacterium]